MLHLYKREGATDEVAFKVVCAHFSKKRVLVRFFYSYSKEMPRYFDRNNGYSRIVCFD